MRFKSASSTLFVLVLIYVVVLKETTCSNHKSQKNRNVRNREAPPGNAVNNAVSERDHVEETSVDYHHHHRQHSDKAKHSGTKGHSKSYKRRTTSVHRNLKSRKNPAVKRIANQKLTQTISNTSIAYLNYKISADVHIRGRYTDCPPYMKLVCRNDNPNCSKPFCADVVNQNALCKDRLPISSCFEDLVCVCDPQYKRYGHYKGTKFTCVEESECEKLCDYNERLLCEEDCTDNSICPEKKINTGKVRCDNYKHTNKDGKTCLGYADPVCRCIHGYSRNSKGYCVRNRACLYCGKNTREVCPEKCIDHSCYDVYDPGQRSCHIYSTGADDNYEMCENNNTVECRCQLKFSRDENNKCKKYQLCPTYWSGVNKETEWNWNSLDENLEGYITSQLVLYVGRIQEQLDPTGTGNPIYKPFPGAFVNYHTYVGLHSVDFHKKHYLRYEDVQVLKKTRKNGILWISMKKNGTPPKKALRAGYKFTQLGHQTYVYVGKIPNYIGPIIDGSFYACSFNGKKRFGIDEQFEILTLNITYED